MREQIEANLRTEAEIDEERERRPMTGDFDLNPMMLDWLDSEQTLKAAAVLVPIVERAEPTVLLTKRTDHLHHHAGQVSFPGGRVEPQDVDVVATALRETEEEIGLSRDFVEIAGYLDDYQTGTGFHITPVVGFVRPGFELDLDDFEVAEAFEVPLSFLFDPANHHRHARVWQGKERRYYAMPYGDYYIWGATAGMLINLYRRVHGDNTAEVASP
jgi:8-oxo-dGTP pyrophosphatase MutT (NUDIX family)